MSKHKKQPIIRILNPLPESSSYTSLKRASQYVADGKAVWDSNCIRFIHPGQVQMALDRERILSLRRSPDQAGYDGVGMMTVDQAQGLPLAGPAQILFNKGNNRMPALRIRCSVLSKITLE